MYIGCVPHWSSLQLYELYVQDGFTTHIDVIADMANVLQTTTDFLLGRVDAQDEFNLHGVKNLLARNAQKMTDEDKLALIKILMGG